jgi:hypothetical protein
LRQAVLVAGELEPVAGALRQALDLGEPFRDPGVGEFGLHNAVFSIGDCFLEVISPTSPGTAAGRYLDRHGDSGYMVIFDLEDLPSARERAEAMGVRIIWRLDLPDISGTHLHPADMRGAIVSIDGSNPYGSWRWGGPDWTGAVGESRGAGALAGLIVAAEDPAGLAARWGQVLGRPPQREDDAVLRLDGAEVRFREPTPGGPEGLVEILLEVPPAVAAGRETIEVGGVTLRLLPRAAVPAQAGSRI